MTGGESEARTHGVARTLLIIAAYLAAFWLALPLALAGAGHLLDSALGLHQGSSLWGLIALFPGLVVMAWGAAELFVRGHGLPISALPPTRLVITGPYRFVRHPLYLGWNVALFGMGLLIGSPGLAYIVAPSAAPAWAAYALREERGLEKRFGERYRRYRRFVGLFPGLDLYRTATLLVRVGLFPVTVEGSNNIPRTGPGIVVPNHACYLDPAFVAQATPRRIWFTTTAEVFRAGVLAFLLRRLPAVPLRRYRPDPAAAREVIRLLRDGELVCIFPEGERSPHGERQAPIRSVAEMIARLGYPVVPVVITGSADVGPRWSDAIRRRRVTVRAGQPIRLTAAKASREIEEAWDALAPQRDERVRLDGLDRGKLARIIWRCPQCGNEEAFSVANLACGGCGTSWRAGKDGGLQSSNGSVGTLASLHRAVRAFPEPGELRAQASGFVEESMYGPIRRLTGLGAGELRIGRDQLTFGELTIPLCAIRSVTTERADTLQVATAERMWQFRIPDGSVFRLKAALERHLDGAAAIR